jgi:hypothetical protein
MQASSRWQSDTAAAAPKADGGRVVGMLLSDPTVLPPNVGSPLPQNAPLPNRRGHTPDAVDHIDLNWSDFMFNLISMCIVYAYFSKASAHNESITAVLLCMGVAALDILLLLMRWLWYAPSPVAIIRF